MTDTRSPRSMLPLIEAKRDGHAHDLASLRFIAEGAAHGTIPDYQLAAWLMAVVCRGMTPAETADLTVAMAESGRMLDLSSLPGPVVDKHSTGGVGDKTSLIVGPLAAATGLTVAKMSGRGLGHTGGTLDKLESIPGLSVDIAPESFLRQAAAIGLVIAGQSEDLAPADKALYALRDVTGTVPSLPLIASSIMSKKIAAGAGAIALDVKFGAGAFMPTLEEARALARTMVELGTHAGRRVVAALSPMEQPLGCAVGNALEVAEAVATLRGDGPADLVSLCLTVTGLMHVAAGRAAHPEEVRTSLERAIHDGSALARFGAMIEAQGGDRRVVEDPAGVLPQAPLVRAVAAPRAGVLARLDARAVGDAAVALGAGRQRKGDAVDPAVGVVLAVKVGEVVDAGEPLAWLHARGDVEASAASERLLAGVTISERAEGAGAAGGEGAVEADAGADRGNGAAMDGDRTAMDGSGEVEILA